ncbi:MAG: hypothetical protein FWF12_05145 [Betaproteobacteria bacterium]|nr:hypothetical protein [Betaproteobacteria bacterium]
MDSTNTVIASEAKQSSVGVMQGFLMLLGKTLWLTVDSLCDDHLEQQAQITIKPSD